MRESTFIHKFKKRWELIEHSEEEDSDKKAIDFIELTGDLSYARTYYPHSKITNYLNDLTLSVYSKLYFSPRGHRNPIFKFWVHDFPELLGRYRKQLWLSTILLFVFALLGAICTRLEPEFIVGIMGSEYLEKTSENISNGKPFGIYESENPVRMFLRIFSNNFFVGLLVFCTGILVGLGSFIHLFKNSVMLGAFFSLFFENNLGFDALFVVMLHGTFELMGLIIEAMAGFILGTSFLFPGKLSRKKAFIIGLKESSLIYLGTIPFTLLAAIIESFVTYLGQGGISGTRWYVLVPLALLFLACWFFVIQYFFVYSRIKAERLNYSSYLREKYAD
jgi:uncharacterized membrane protein SpoIIM required for sporulation